MLVLGVLLMMATGAFTALLITENWSGTPEYTVTMFGNDLGTLNSVGIFVAGLALAALFMLAFGLAAGGGLMMRRRRRRFADRNAEWQATERPQTADRAADTPGPTASDSVPEQSPGRREPPMPPPGSHRA